MGNLRSLWSQLRNEQRSALVAMALGWRLRAVTVWIDESEDRRSVERFWAYPPNVSEPWDNIPAHSDRWRAAEWTEARAWEAGALPNISEWSTFGLIWDEASSRGFSINISEVGDEDLRYRVAIGCFDVQHVAEDEFRQAFALAFCLASEVEVPEAWLEPTER